MTTPEPQAEGPTLSFPCPPWWRDKYATHPGVWPIYEDFKVFLKLVWKHLRLPPPTEVQDDIADYLQYGQRRRVIEAFRGVGKSYITSAFVCWLLLRDPDMAIMVVSASKDRSDAFSTFTKRLISEMELLQHLKSRLGQRDSNVAFDVGPARAKHSPSVKAVGITGQLSGSRANLIVADDVEVPNNSETQNTREKLAESVKEFDAILIPGGHIVYLGTPQTEQSLYNRLPERGYDIRVWPSEIPEPTEKELHERKDYVSRMGAKLAPYVLRKLEAGLRYGHSLDPKRFTEHDLAERRMSYGNSGYALQFLLDTSLSDANKYPLKLKDLIVMPLDPEKGPCSVAWGPQPKNLLHDVFTPGLDGDAFYRPAFVDDRFSAYTGSVMHIDPSGRGKDETAWAVTKLLNATVFATLIRGTQGGYEDAVLRRIACDARDQKVHLIRVEQNFGQGMFAKLLQPHLLAVGHKCAVEEVPANKQKELRIIDILEPVMNQHRLVVNEGILREDSDSVTGYDQDKQTQYRLFYQMSRITKLKGALAHDDRLDALAGSVEYWVDSLARDAKTAYEQSNEAAHKKELKEFFANQMSAEWRPKGSKARKAGQFALNNGTKKRELYEFKKS